MQFRLGNYLFKPSLLGLLILIVCIPLFIKLGLWQYNKAQLGKEMQVSYSHSLAQIPLILPNKITNLADWNYKKVKVKGYYETKYQILLDNQVESNIAGFYVITPLKLENSNDYVLINRGWIAGGDTHSDLPKFNTPDQIQELVGLAWLPSKKIFTLESKPEKSTWNTVWQHMDMDLYQKAVPIHVLPIVIKLDPKSNAGGFVRNWQLPTSRITTNIGYAYQWFGFAIASILIFIFTNTKKVILTKT